MIRVTLPAHLRKLARVGDEVQITIVGDPTIGAAITALERQYPMLRGTICEHETGRRRAFVRFFACGQDISHQPLDSLLPASVSSGAQPLMIIGAIAGG